jgi:hypothetical protein
MQGFRGETSKKRDPLENINAINNAAYYRIWNHVNSGLSLTVGFKPGMLRSLDGMRVPEHVAAACLTLICN